MHTRKALITLAALAALATSAEAAPATPDAVVKSLLQLAVHEPFEKRLGLNRRGEFRWLSSRLQKLASAAECDAAQARSEDDEANGVSKLEYADGGSLFDRWDTPTSCRTLRSRTLGLTASVEALCSWGPKTDHMTGRLQLHFLLVREKGAWVVLEVLHGAQEDSRSPEEVTTSTFSGRLESLTRQSAHPEICLRKHGLQKAEPGVPLQSADPPHH